MRTRLKVSIGVLVGIFMFIVIVSAIVSMPSNQQNTDTTGSTDNASPSPNASPNITIAYSVEKEQYVITSHYDVILPDSDKVFLEVNVTIRNNGYSDSFNTNPYYFNLVADNIKYSNNYDTLRAGKWNTVDVLNDGTYNGILVFQVPESTTSFTLGYEAFYPTFNIIWTQT